jgi:hypothetical protein
MMPAPGSQAGLAPGAAGGPAPSQAPPAAVLHFQLLLEAREWRSVAQAYTRPWRPLQWYALGLHQHSQRQLEEQRKQLLRAWLASCSPAIPAPCVGESHPRLQCLCASCAGMQVPTVHAWYVAW